MAIVIDASAAVNIVQGSEEGRALKYFLEEDREIFAPDTFAAECANSFWKYVHGGLLEKDEAKRQFAASQALVTRFIRPNVLVNEVFHTAMRLHHPVYDVVYLVLARRMDATLMTLDQKLMDLCEQEGVDYIVPVIL